MSISELLGLNSPRGLLAGGFGNEGGEFPTTPMLTSTPNGGFQVKIVHFPATRALVAILIFTSLKFLRVALLQFKYDDKSFNYASAASSSSTKRHPMAPNNANQHKSIR